MEIAGKVALVTGGAHRVGRAISLMLAAAGAAVAVNYYQSAAAARRLVAEVEADGGKALALPADVADYGAVGAMMSDIERQFGRLDIVINSAGFFRKTPVPLADPDLWNRVTSVSIDGTFNVCNAAVPIMRRSDSGVVIQIVDASATRPWTGFTAHAVGKAGMVALTRQLALELAPDIRVNAVSAGPVLAGEGLGERGRAAVAARTLLGRWGDENDVAVAVQYLIESDYVTGEVLAVDGGEQLGYRMRDIAGNG